MSLFEIFHDKEYLHRLAVIALPLVLQQVITYSVNLLDTMMIGSFGDAPLAAVNLVNQFYLIFSVTIFGTITGGNVMNAQFWGKRDVRQIRRVMGIQLTFSILIGMFFFAVSGLFPHRILRFYSSDEEVIRSGMTYLRIILPIFLLFPVGQVFSGAMRCTGNTRLPMFISAGTLIVNAILNYILIFGKLGFTAMGLVGAGAATVIARAMEMILYIFITAYRHLPIAARPKEYFCFNRPLVLIVIRKGLPVILNELVWGLGVNAYTAIYAGISTASIAAFSAISPIDNMAQALFMGVGDGSAVIIGNLLGAGEINKAKRYAGYTLILSWCTAVMTGLLLFGMSSPIIRLYALSDAGADLAFKLLTAVSFTLWLRTSNYTIVIGVLRPGGQTLYCLLAETAAIWLVGVPLAWLLAVRFTLPIHQVYFGTVTEETVKLILFFLHYRSGKWAVNLTTPDN